MRYLNLIPHYSATTISLFTHLSFFFHSMSASYWYWLAQSALYLNWAMIVSPRSASYYWAIIVFDWQHHHSYAHLLTLNSCSHHLAVNADATYRNLNQNHSSCFLKIMTQSFTDSIENVYSENYCDLALKHCCFCRSDHSHIFDSRHWKSYSKQTFASKWNTAASWGASY